MVGGRNMEGKNSGLQLDSYGLKGPFRGHMALKSSPLAATSTRLTNQYLVQDQMASHYRRVNSAKAAVDTKPPKSMQISTKTRDRQKRKELERTSRMSSRAGSRASSRDYTPPRSSRLRDDYEKGLTDYDYDFVNDMVEDTRYSPSTYRTPRVMKSSVPPGWTPRTRTLQEDHPMQTMKWDKMDLLDTAQHKFKEPDKPYTPRTLKREAKSKIAQSKNYNPPKRKSQYNGDQKLGQTKQSEFLSTVNTIPEYNGDIERTASTNMELNTAIRYSDIEKTRKAIPTLKIKRDQDHAKWVEDQAQRVAAMNLNETGDYDDYAMDGVGDSTMNEAGKLEDTAAFTTMKSEKDGAAFTTMKSEVDGANYSLRHLSTTPTQYLSYTRRLNNAKVKEEEEELKYLEFVTDVTNDVLNRGIYSNRVLKQIFEKHIERNRGQLDDRRMRRLMEQLRVDLGIPDYD
ncbi:spermatogenesis-associated protein 7-like [Ptychodera flava]|uniref:spermatogenesis-associated protein 7-like n=1 Tax=Ptychodera flava TaxID=63121 RepID=UPI003969FB10